MGVFLEVQGQQGEEVTELFSSLVARLEEIRYDGEELLFKADINRSEVE